MSSPILVRDVKAVGTQWVEEVASKIQNFQGALIGGSINWMNDDDPFPPSSDLDIKVIVDDGNSSTEQTFDPIPADLRKPFRLNDVLLDVTFESSSKFKTPEAILGNYVFAGYFTTPCIISDPTGTLTQIQSIVAREFPRRQWVRQRCEGNENLMMMILGMLDESMSFAEQVDLWGNGILLSAHRILVADLMNPTTMKCLIAVREILARYNLLPFYDDLLDLFGSRYMSRVHVEQYFAAMIKVYEVAKSILKTPFFLSTTISDEFLPMIIEKTPQMIAAGDHREAVFLIAAFHNRCQRALDNDADSQMHAKYTPAYHALMSGLGMTTAADVKRRIEQIKQFSLRLNEVAERIMAANPTIVD